MHIASVARTCALILVLAASAASAKPLPGDKHSPPIAADPTSLVLRLLDRDSGYTAHLEVVVHGATSKSDRLSAEWKQNGKVVATLKCDSYRFTEKYKTLRGTCTLEEAVTVKGKVDVDILYIDDQDEKTFHVTTLRLDVRRWQGIGKYLDWGYVPDDLLALGYVEHVDDSSYFHTPMFLFWSSGALLGKSPQFRCTVDGKKLPDFDSHIGNHTLTNGASIEHIWTREKDRKAYVFQHYSVDPGFKWGPKEDFKSYDITQLRFLIDNPGKWDCGLRLDGKTVRKFTFTVNAKGMIEPSEMSAGKWPTLKLFDDMALVDMRIPDDNGFETRIRTDALKKGVGWGLPWPEHPKAKEAQAALPKSMGIPD